jgi:4-amino-4-deoxy-L-arabinose transferase-like glycosyltransferase
MESTPVPDLSTRRATLFAILIAAAVFAAVAPTLRWIELTGGNENIVVETALEIRRNGTWLLPTMLGEPRIKKPPLVAWITAASMRGQTLRELDDPQRSDAAYRDLAWQVRWTGLLAGCLTIVATFALARLILNNRLALVAAAAVGTMILFQKYMRQSTTDVHLTLWVTVANAALAYGLLRRRWRGPTIVTAIALGIAFLCKGPVALLLTLAPAIVFWLWFLPPRGRPGGGGGGKVA